MNCVEIKSAIDLAMFMHVDKGVRPVIFSSKDGGSHVIGKFPGNLPLPKIFGAHFCVPQDVVGSSPGIAYTQIPVLSGVPVPIIRSIKGAMLEYYDHVIVFSADPSGLTILGITGNTVEPLIVDITADGVFTSSPAAATRLGNVFPNVWQIPVPTPWVLNPKGYFEPC